MKEALWDPHFYLLRNKYLIIPPKLEQVLSLQQCRLGITLDRAYLTKKELFQKRKVYGLAAKQLLEDEKEQKLKRLEDRERRRLEVVCVSQQREAQQREEKNVPQQVNDSFVIRQIIDELEDIWDEHEISETHRMLLGQMLSELPLDKCEEVAKGEASMTEKGKSYAQLAERAYRWRCTCIMKILDLEDRFKEEFPEDTELSRIEMSEMQNQFSQEVSGVFSAG